MFKSNTRRLMITLMSAASILPGMAYAAEIGGSLTDAMNAATPSEKLEVIVSFNGDSGPTGAQLAELDVLGLTGVHFQELPIAAVMATPEQILSLDAMEDVRSLWLNEELAYDNDLETSIMGVDRLRADSNMRSAMGLPYSGKGVGVMINDSGVDGQHPDLQHNVKQNVAAQFNLNSYQELLPVTWIENIPDTDIAGGHGSHVAGIVAGTGAASGGIQEGAAPGVDLIGYGSGAGLFLLDTIGAFDYALVNQIRYNIRVVANSFGSTSDTGTDFNAEDPTNIATKKLADRGVIVVISAGNSGSGEGTITGNFKKAPWIITVGAGDNSGNLADFSSRGRRDVGGTVVVDGETLQWVDQPTLVAPGVDVISVKSKSDPLAYAGVDPTQGGETLYYTTKSGTSMASPNVSGTVALMLEANPNMSWREVKSILQETATNMPGRDEWEVGAGYVNTYAAVSMASDIRTDFGDTQTINRDFNAELFESRVDGPDFELAHNPVGEKQIETFEVAAGLSTVSASANVGDNAVAIVLKDPDGNRYGSSISLPVLGQNVAVTAPAIPGTWTIELGGIGSVSGVALDPLGVTNGYAVPVVTADVGINFFRVDGFTGLDDIANHPAKAFIEKGVAERLLDAQPTGYNPDALLTRGELADYLTLGGNIRQFRATDGSSAFVDTQAGLQNASAEAVTVRGAAQRDLRQNQDGVMRGNNGQFNPLGSVSRQDLAYTLIQSLGMEAEAEAARAALEGEAITVSNGDERVALTDDADINADMRGYVQLALDLQLMRASFSLSQGPFDLTPTLSAAFDANKNVDRGTFAFNAVNLLDRLNQVSE